MAQHGLRGGVARAARRAFEATQPVPPEIEHPRSLAVPVGLARNISVPYLRQLVGILR